MPASDLPALKRAAIILVGAVLLLWPAILNGSPFIYYDTGGYLSRPDAIIRAFAKKSEFAAWLAGDGDVEPLGRVARGSDPSAAAAPTHENIIGGRSMFYGALAWLSVRLTQSLWLVAALQAAMTSLVLMIAWRRFTSVGASVYLAALTTLSVITPVAFFVSLAMPDCFAPLTVISMAVLICASDDIPRWKLVTLAATALIAMLTHLSHLAVGVGVAVAAAGVTLIPPLRRICSRRGLAVAAACLSLAACGHWAVDFAARKMMSVTVIGQPHFTAHFMDSGPGVSWLSRRCPAQAPDFVICKYRDRLPTEWRAFLFDRDPATGVFSASDTSAEDQRALSLQDVALGRAILLDSPLEVVRFAVSEFVDQTLMVRIEAVPIYGEVLEERKAWFPAGVYGAAHVARVTEHPGLLSLASDVYEYAALAAVGALMIAAAAGWRHSRGEEQVRIVIFISLLLVGLLANAAVCGIIASPYHRFQARVVMLAPLAAMLAFAPRRSGRTAKKDGAAAPSLHARAAR